jgi:selenide,water dikinase
MDAFPGGSRSNLLSVEPDMFWDGDFAKYEKLLLADAQTSGGLLISIKSELSEKLESELSTRKVKFDKIGSVADKEKWLIKIQKN